jgi:hypothetical protein
MATIENAVHISESSDPMDPAYRYDSTGLGVHGDLVEAVLAKWASASPYGTPSGTLAAVDQGALNEVGNIARMAVAAILEELGLVER